MVFLVLGLVVRYGEWAPLDDPCVLRCVGGV